MCLPPAPSHGTRQRTQELPPIEPHNDNGGFSLRGPDCEGNLWLEHEGFGAITTINLGPVDAAEDVLRRYLARRRPGSLHL